MLLEWNIVVDKLLGKDHAVLYVDISIGHPVSQEKLFALDPLQPVYQTGFLVTTKVFGGQWESHVSFGISRFIESPINNGRNGNSTCQKVGMALR